MIFRVLYEKYFMLSFYVAQGMCNECVEDRGGLQCSASDKYYKSIYWRFDNVVAFHVFSSKGLALWILPSRCTRGSLPILIKCHTEAMLRGFEK